jgi:hypothetical protein
VPEQVSLIAAVKVGLRRVVRAIFLAITILYFLIDLLFLSIVRPLRRRLMALGPVQRLREWIAGLNRYAALLLLLVPWLLLEPIKPIGFLLFAHKHHLVATLVLAAGEVIKLTLFEQLFDMTKPKLMTFAWFAWYYGRWRAAVEYLRSLPAWRRMLGWYRMLRTWVLRKRTTFSQL